MKDKMRNWMFSITLWASSLLIILFIFQGIRIISYLFLTIIVTLSFYLSNIILLENRKRNFFGLAGFIIGFSTTLIWLITGAYLGRITVVNLSTAFLAVPLIIFYSLIGLLGGIISYSSKKKPKLNNLLKILLISFLIIFIVFTITKDFYILNKNNTEGIYCDEFIINFVGEPVHGEYAMYLTLFGQTILKDNCNMRTWGEVIEKYPEIEIMEEAIKNKDPDKCNIIQDKGLILTEDYRFKEPVRSLVYSSFDLSKIYDQCIYAVTLITKDKILCEKLSEKKSREDCYFDIAMLNSDETLCERISNTIGHIDFGSLRDLCYRDVNKSEYPKGYFNKEAETILINGNLEFFDKSS